MREELGFDTYIAQGGDWGSVVTSLIGLNHSVEKGGGCKAIHINMYGLRSETAPETEEEENGWPKLPPSCRPKALICRCK